MSEPSLRIEPSRCYNRYPSVQKEQEIMNKVIGQHQMTRQKELRCVGPVKLIKGCQYRNTRSSSCFLPIQGTMGVEVCGEERFFENCQVSEPQWDPIGESILSDLIENQGTMDRSAKEFCSTFPQGQEYDLSFHAFVNSAPHIFPSAWPPPFSQSPRLLGTITLIVLDQ